MEFYKIGVKFFDGRELEIVGERVNVKEFLEYWLNKVSCGVVWVKNGVNCVEDLENWEYDDIVWYFYRRAGNKLVWERREKYLDLG